MSHPPAAWYPDPYPPGAGQPRLLRYWDGRGWTAHVHPAAPMPGRAHPVVAPAARPTTPDGAPLAEWWQRLCAYLIDSPIVTVVAVTATFPLMVDMQARLSDLLTRLESDLSRSAEPPNMLGYLRDCIEILVPPFIGWMIATLVVFAVYSSLMLRFKGATLGKMALGIGVRLRERPGRLPWSAILLRVVVQQGVLLTAVLPLLYLALSWFPYLDAGWMLWDDKRQALHDKAAKTNVVTV